MHPDKAWSLISSSLLCPENRLKTYQRVKARGNWSKEYIEFCIEEARDYEIASNYGAW